MEFIIPIAVIALLVASNGIFVAAEFSIVGAPRATIERRSRDGSRLARRVLRILEDPRRQDRYIATTQIGITVASLGLGMYGEIWLADRLAVQLELLGTGRWIAAHTLASVVAVGALTYVHIVLGEMVPKAIALQWAHRAVLYVSPAIEVLELALLPLVAALNGIGNGILRLVGIERRHVQAERYFTPEELELIVQESHAGGLLRGESGQILRELFEFGDLTAGEVMVPRVQVVGIPVGAEPDDLRAIVRAHPHTRYPVFDGNLDHIIGSLHIKDVLRHLVDEQPVGAGDARPLPYVPGPVLLDEVLAAMRRQRVQMVVVMDQHGGTAGIVTMEDLFEEVVGDIEEGRGRAPVVREGDGRLRVRGTVRLSEIGQTLGLPLEHPKVTTVSGLVLLELRGPATVGAVVVWNGVRIEVTATAGRGVAEARVTRMPAPHGPSARTPP